MLRPNSTLECYCAVVLTTLILHKFTSDMSAGLNVIIPSAYIRIGYSL